MNDESREKKGPPSGGGGQELSAELRAEVESALAEGGSATAFDRLLAILEREHKYQEIFEILVMKSRHELGLPLLQVGSTTDIPAKLIEPHEDAIAVACSKVGRLFLEAGNLGKAWPYLRAVEEKEEIHAVIDAIDPGTRRKDIDTIIEIALNDGVHPRRGLEMSVRHYGICNAITSFEQQQMSMPSRDQEECARVLLTSLFTDLIETILDAAVDQHSRSKDQPLAGSLHEIIQQQPDLFEGDAYYVDTSHLWAVIRFSSFLNDPVDLGMALELIEYGTQLSDIFKYESEPPFEDFYEDHRLYLQGVLAKARGDQEAASMAAEHFVVKGQRAIEERSVGYPTRGLLNVLVRMGCPGQALDLALAFEATGTFGICQQPGVYELCQLAGDYDRLIQLALERGDPVGFAAGLIPRGPGAVDDSTSGS